jgi:SIR2-like protein
MAIEVGAGALELIAKEIRQGRCILFLGAGVHAGPPEGREEEYAEELRPPIGAALSRRLAAECNLAARYPDECDDDLQRVSLFYEIDRSRRQLVDSVKRAVQGGKKPSPMVNALAELDFPVVITTNYDRHFENALLAAGKDPRVSVYSPAQDQETTEHYDPTPDSPIVVKIHGDISRPETLVLTDEDYIQFILRMSDKDPYDPIPLSLKLHLRTRTTLFVGYSLMDYNLRLLFKTLKWRIDPAKLPECYSVDVKPDPLILDVWQSQRRYVKFIAEDVWAFVPALAALLEDKEQEP